MTKAKGTTTTTRHVYHVRGLPLFHDLEVNQVEVADLDGVPLAKATGGDTIAVAWGVSNIGNGSTADVRAFWNDEVTLSQTPDPDEVTSMRRSIGTRRFLGELAANDSYGVPALGGIGDEPEHYTIILPPNAEGKFMSVETGFFPHDPSRMNNRPHRAAGSLASRACRPASHQRRGRISRRRWCHSFWRIRSRPMGSDQFWRRYVAWDRVLTDQVYFPSRIHSAPFSASYAGQARHPGDQVVPSGQSYEAEAIVELPDGIPNDEGDFDYFFHVRTSVTPRLQETWKDVYDTVAYQAEEDYANDWGTQEFTVSYAEPDLQIVNVRILDSDRAETTTVPRGGQLTARWETINVGTRATRQTGWTDRVYLSRDETLDDTDLLLREFPGESLNVADSYPSELSFELPIDLIGDYHLIVYATRPPDLAVRSRSFPEFSDEFNNDFASTLTITQVDAPDLQVRNIAIAEQVTQAQPLEFSYEIINAGGDMSPRETSWQDVFYLSRDPFLDTAKDRFLGRYEHTNVELDAGAAPVNVTCETSLELIVQCRAPANAKRSGRSLLPNCCHRPWEHIQPKSSHLRTRQRAKQHVRQSKAGGNHSTATGRLANRCRVHCRNERYVASGQRSHRSV